MKKLYGVFRIFALLIAAGVVLAFTGCGGGGGGGVFLPLPSAPSNLTATAVSSAGIDLAWSDNSDNETGFSIERGTDGVNFAEVGTTAANTAAYSDTGLAVSTTYYYRVRATSKTGNSTYSNIANATTQAPPVTIPAAPTSLLATAVSSTGIDLSWTDNSSNETGFKIERSTDNVNFTLITTTAANATSYSNTGLTASTTYYYRVAATNSAGDSTYTSTANATTQAPPITIPSAPSNLLATAPSSTNINLAWTDNSSDETGFKIERSADNVTFGLLATVGPNTTHYTDTGLTPVTTYYYRVAATNSAGDSTYSNTANATTKILTFSDFQPASVVIGKPTFSSNAYSTPTATIVMYPQGAPAVVNGVLYLPDGGYSRVLGFNSIPTSNGAAADFVLGQPSMTVNSSGTTSSQIGLPMDVRTWNGKLLVDDYNSSRIMIWNSAPTTTMAPADVVVGQADFTSYVTGCTSTIVEDELEGMTVTPDGKLIVADSANNRVLIWNSVPTTNGAPANLVLGQSDFLHSQYNDDLQTGVSGTATDRTLNFPTSVWSDGTRLIVVDQDNNRVLIWNTFPTSNFDRANLVLGQSDFLHTQYNDDLQTGVSGTATDRTLDWPFGVDSNGTQVFVVDVNNNRVLIWNSFPTSNFAPADVVLGQGDFAHSQHNDDDQNGVADSSPTARTLFYPAGVYVEGTKLFVTDEDNSRYLIFEAQ